MLLLLPSSILSYMLFIFLMYIFESLWFLESFKVNFIEIYTFYKSLSKF